MKHTHEFIENDCSGNDDSMVDVFNVQNIILTVQALNLSGSRYYKMLT